MSVRAPRPPATYADLEALPPNMVGQILDGELIAMPRPASLHALVTSVLATDLGGAFSRGRGGPGGWLILFEPELHQGGHVIVPDLAGWRRERMPEMPDAPAFTLAPDWVCEVVSPSSASIDRVRKNRIYASLAVPHFWIIDPAARTLEVLRLESERYAIVQTSEGDESVHPEPFEAVPLELGALWRR